MYYGIEFSRKVHDVEPSDLFRKINQVYGLPMIENLDVFEGKLANDKTFKPFGTLLTTYNVDLPEGGEQQFEIYYCTNSVPEFKNFYKRLETFVIWFIDAASFIDFDDVNWNFFLVYEKYISADNTVSYGVVGLTTVYNYYAYPNKIRPRISQVLVLPPFQSKGICAKLLQAIYAHYSTRNDVMDFTVEDPAENFQRVRDFIDCQRVEAADFYSPDLLKDKIPSDLLEKLHSQLSLNKKQAYRVCEILRLKNLETSDPEEVRKYRLDVKQRLNQPFQKQRMLMQKYASAVPNQVLEGSIASDEERKEKLETMYNELVEQYTCVINRLNE